ncbi:WcbI family polysaccharide biosynthesis putative acetyltransferase [Muricoccus nepalensis]|uniref:WcbI family polysaccharide biosynthesis putative acetyltransferase n=1 Tax=Muricoccus nepalensis TaxID=1854500 RepID=UPI001127ABA5|nr:WcbI family polysaccharide biosynthesis putative acetyltransferase [Roseomonas nepalensis]
MQKTTSSDVVWAFRHLLGREPEGADVIEQHRTSVPDPANLPRFLFRSKEAFSRLGLAPTVGQFCRYRPQAQKILVIGNCQGPNLACAIAAMSDVSVFGVEAMYYTKAPDIFREAIASADVIMTCVLADHFDEIATSRLRLISPKPVVTYSPLYFDGLLPDMTYWGHHADRAKSPVGEYHSKIVLQSFFKGLTEGNCLNRFRLEEYQALGYGERTKISLAELDKREADCDVKFTSFIADQFRKHLLFLTFNHPTTTLFLHVAQKLCRAAKISVNAIAQNSFYNSLLQDTVWPIYSGIAQLNRLEFPVGQAFSKQGIIITLEEFVWRSYEIYTSFGAERLLQSASGTQRKEVLNA